MKSVFITLIMSLILASTFAQTPGKMSYQAVVRDSNNDLVADRVVGVQVRLIQGEENGVVVYSETLTASTNSNGLLTIEIGNETGFDEINWAHGPYYLGTAIDPNGGNTYTITGTTQLLSVPYALFAENSNDTSLWSRTGNDIFYTQGNVGVGTSTPGHRFQAEDDGNSHLYFRNNGNLSNNGSQFLVGHKSNGFAAFYLDAADGDGAGLDYAIIKQRNDLSLEMVNLGNNPIHFKTNGDNNSSARLSILGNGNVGIGTTSPANKFQIEESGNSRLYFRNNGDLSNNGSQFLVGHKSNGFAAFYLDAADGDGTGLDYAILKQRNDLSLEMVNLGNNPIHFKTNGDDNSSARLSILGNGNVGIGTTSPANKFQIEESGNSHLYFRNNGNLSNNGSQFLVGHKSNGFAAFYLDAADGDGTGLDYAILKQRNDLSLELVNLGNNPIHFKTNGDNASSTRLSIRGNGNVGIGTQTPSSKLQVSAGDIYIEDINNGVIMKSPNGQCWRITVDNNGSLVSTAVSCP